MTQLTIKRNHLGFSLLEILIGITILGLMTSAFVYSARSRRLEAEKIAEFFLAYSVAQKVVEDIEVRCSSNPHFINELAELDDSWLISEPENLFFQYFVDRTGDGTFLDQEFGIQENDGEIYRRMKDYRVGVKAEMVEGSPGLAKVDIEISWVDLTGRNRNFLIPFMVSGFTSSLRQYPDINHPDVLSGDFKKMISRHFFYNDNEQPDVEAVSRGADAEDFMAVASITVAVKSVRNYNDSLANQIRRIDNQAITPRVRIILKSQLYERMAVATINTLNFCYPYIKYLNEQEDIVLGELHSEYEIRKYFNEVRSLKLYDEDGKRNPTALLWLFTSLIDRSLEGYLDVMTRASLRSDLTISEKRNYTYKISDLAKVQILFDRTFLDYQSHAGRKHIHLPTLARGALESLYDSYRGRDYNRAQFCQEELKVIQEQYKLRELYSSTASRRDNIYNMDQLVKPVGQLLVDKSKQYEQEMIAEN